MLFRSAGKDTPPCETSSGAKTPPPWPNRHREDRRKPASVSEKKRSLYSGGFREVLTCIILLCQEIHKKIKQTFAKARRRVPERNLQDPSERTLCGKERTRQQSAVATTWRRCRAVRLMLRWRFGWLPAYTFDCPGWHMALARWCCSRLTLVRRVRGLAAIFFALGFVRDAQFRPVTPARRAFVLRHPRGRHSGFREVW